MTKLLIILVLVLALLAIPMSFVNPRAGRSSNLIMALLIYAIYSNLLSVSQAWVAQGKMSFDAAWWPIHLLMLALLPLLVFVLVMGLMFRSVTAPVAGEVAGAVEMGSAAEAASSLQGQGPEGAAQVYGLPVPQDDPSGAEQ